MVGPKALVEYVWFVITYKDVCLYNFLLTNIFTEQLEKNKKEWLCYKLTTAEVAFSFQG